jgi:hypothetical protein
MVKLKSLIYLKKIKIMFKQLLIPVQIQRLLVKELERTGSILSVKVQTV